MRAADTGTGAGGGGTAPAPAPCDAPAGITPGPIGPPVDPAGAAGPADGTDGAGASGIGDDGAELTFTFAFTGAEPEPPPDDDADAAGADAAGGGGAAAGGGACSGVDGVDAAAAGFTGGPVCVNGWVTFDAASLIALVKSLSCCCCGFSAAGLRLPGMFGEDGVPGAPLGDPILGAPGAPGAPLTGVSEGAPTPGTWCVGGALTPGPGVVTGGSRVSGCSPEPLDPSPTSF